MPRPPGFIRGLFLLGIITKTPPSFVTINSTNLTKCETQLSNKIHYIDHRVFITKPPQGQPKYIIPDPIPFGQTYTNTGKEGSVKQALARASRVIRYTKNDTSSLGAPRGITRPPTLVAEESRYSDVSEATLERVKVIFWFTIFPLFIILGIFGNVLNLVTLFSGALKGVAYIYLKWMAVADLSVNLLAIPWALENFVYYAANNSVPALESRAFVTFLCRIDLVLLNGFMKASVLLVIALTVERYIAVCHPVRYKILCTDSRAKIVVIVCYLIAFAISLPLAFQYQVIPKIPIPPVYIVGSSNKNDNFTNLLMSRSGTGLEAQDSGYKIYLENPISGDFNIPFEEGILTTIPYPIDVINGSLIRILAQVKSLGPMTNSDGSKVTASSYQNIRIQNISQAEAYPKTSEPVRYTFDTNIVVSNSVAYKIGYVWFKEIFLTFLPIALLVYFNFRIAQDFRKIVQKRRRMMAKELKEPSPNKTFNPFKKGNGTTISIPFYPAKKKKMLCHAKTSPTFKNMSASDSIHLRPEKYDFDKLIRTYPKLKETSIDEMLDIRQNSELESELIDLSRKRPSQIQDPDLDDFKTSMIGKGEMSNIMEFSRKKCSVTNLETELPRQKGYTQNYRPTNNARHKSPHFKRGFRWSSLKKRDARDSNALLEEEDLVAKNQQRQRQRQIKIKRKFQNEKRLIALMVAVVVLFLVCILPAAIISIFFRFERYRSRNSLRIGLIVSDTLEICNYSLNFYLYCFCSSDVRKALWKSLSCRGPPRPGSCLGKICQIISCNRYRPKDLGHTREQSQFAKDGYSEMETTHEYGKSKVGRNFLNGKVTGSASPPFKPSNIITNESTMVTGTELGRIVEKAYFTPGTQTAKVDTLVHISTKNGPKNGVSSIHSAIILQHEKDKEYQV